MKRIVKLGACNGKLRPVLNEYLSVLGIKEIDDSRQVFYSFEMNDYILNIYLMRYIDLCKYASFFDLLLYGEDQIMENRIPNIINLMYLKQDNCRLSLLTIKEYSKLSLDSLLKMDIATNYPKILSKYCSSDNVKVMYGSLEVAPYMDIANVIFDIVVTGKSARLNNLYEVEKIMDIGAYIGTVKEYLVNEYYELGLVKDDLYGNNK